VQPQEILEFWFTELLPTQWFRPDPAVDTAIKLRFGPVCSDLARGVPDNWTSTAHGALASVLVLDQFPRNIHRGTPQAFATDTMALAIAGKAIQKGFDLELAKSERQFLYMPYQHAEDQVAQDKSITLYTALGDPDVLAFALRHADIIRRFGRFPHRNAILGRISSEAERLFLNEPGSSF
jgi:uncharacterized protein (DUF924 family)